MGINARRHTNNSALPILPTAEDNLIKTYSTLAPLSPGLPNAYTTRRHHRRKSSMIIVPPHVPADEQGSDLLASRGMQGETATTPKRPALSGAQVAKGATALAGAQALAKLLTFALNQALLRFVATRDLGLSTRMDFFNTCVLSLARDAVRVAGQRQTLRNKAQSEYRPGGAPVLGTISGTFQAAINIAWVPVALGLPLATAMFFGSLYSGIPRAVALIYSFSSMIELVSEPCFAIVQLSLDMGLRARIESVGMISRTVVTLLCVALGHEPLLGYALGQMAYSAAVSLFYYGYVLRSHSKPFPKPVWLEDQDTQAYIDPEIRSVALGMYAQALFKHFLTESDRFIVSLLLSAEAQGEYALASNYGSLVARMGLFPIEEALRGVFAKATKLNKKDTTADRPKGPTNLRQSRVPASPVVNRRELHHPSPVNSPRTPVIPSSPSIIKREEYSIEFTSEILTTVLRIYSYLGILATILGPAVAEYVLSFVLPRGWANSEASQTLSVYACYIPVLAWNGALEALIQSVASVQDLKSQTTAMVVLTIVFALQAWFFMSILGLNAPGLVLAQISNMVLRVVWNLYFVSKYFEQFGLKVKGWLGMCLPAKAVVACAVPGAALVVTQGKARSPKVFIFDVLVGVFLMGSVYWSESHRLRLVTRNIKNKTTKN